MSDDNFANKVRDIVSKIPEGSTLSYKQVAVLAGSPNAARAVGQIMSKNYDSKIPCHRVICSDGRIGGYNRGGETRKRAILKKESILPL